MTHRPELPTRALASAAAACVLAALGACGGAAAPPGYDTSSNTGSDTSSIEVASATTTLGLQIDSLPGDVGAQWAQPSFHVAPVLLDSPTDDDALNPAASAHRGPRTQSVPAALEGLNTQRLTLGALQSAQRMRSLSAATGADGTAAPMAGSGVVSTYSPAQIRAAYGLSILPASGTALTAAQAAALGAGQTIYIVDAMHDPNAVAELTAFNQKFGLPGCTTKAVAANAALPLAAASTTACEVSVVYATAAGTMSSVAPAYDSGWATEIALDVQWAHATAPLARIVLIEAPDATLNSLVGAIKVANAMGPGIVSMSFGAAEGNWTSTTDSAFAGTGMSYLAATGDNGAAVAWPAVSPKVLAVGGTSLTWSGSGVRSETAWAGTGGGVSAYTATPTYQNSAVPGMGSPVRRTLADVAFNANPSTGQYTAVMTPGVSTVNWLSVGGTSLATPQWAGLLAVANAQRALSAKAVLGAPHAVLYGQIASVATSYASSFADITTGSNGSCAQCSAKVGYDIPTGLGTPNATALLGALAGYTPAPVAPVVTAAAIAGQVGTALSFTVSASSANALTYTLSGAPAGMSIASTGVVTWTTPVAGTYAVTVIAKDSVTALTGQAVYTVTIAPATPPVVTAATVSGKIGTALSYTVQVSAANAVTYTLTGAPTGMTISAAGVLSWATPVVGNFAVTVTAKDSKTGLSGSAVLTVVIAAATAPTVTPATVTGRVGTALSYTVQTTSSNALTYTLAGAPTGMAISSAGVISWASPVAGNYNVTVTAKDSKTGLSGQGLIQVQIAAVGPVITATTMTGVAGVALTGTITITDPGATSLSISLSGVPLGMSFSISGSTLTARWASPVTGSYPMVVKVVDNAGRTATATVPVTITAR